MPSKQLALIPDEPPPPAPKNFDLLFTLLQQVTSIGVVSEFLQSRGLKFSAGSWEDLKTKRLLPALHKKDLSMDDLLGLLSEAEEFGRMHTFLYTVSREDAVKMTDAAVVQKIAADNGLSSALGIGRVLDQPASPAIAAVRVEDDKRGRSLTIKIVEKRQEHQFVGESMHGNRFRREWEIVEVRAVNCVRLFSFGLLEVRVASHYSSVKYGSDLKRLLKMVEPFVSGKKLKDYSLAKTKFRLWTKREELKDVIRFSNSTLRNGVGSTLAAASPSEEGDLFKDTAVTASIDSFWAAGEVYCENSNIYWQAAEGGLPSKEIHVILPELRNEFAIPANCSRADYEYVFDQLRTYSS